MAPIKLADITILTGVAVSEWFVLPKHGAIESLSIMAPDAVDGTITVEVSDTREGTDPRDLQSGGSDVTVPADSAVVLTDLAFVALRLRQGINATVDRVFSIVAEERPR